MGKRKSSFWKKLQELKNTLFGGEQPRSELAPAPPSEGRRPAEKHKEVPPSRTPRKQKRPPELPDHATQFSQVGEVESAIITIGLDWGTSCSKVVLRDFERETAYAVSFGNLGVGDNPYLLPSQLFIDHTGIGTLERRPNTVALSDLKLRLMDRPNTPFNLSSLAQEVVPSTAAVVYLALALQKTRQWFFRHLSEIFKQYAIEWQLNLGIPAASFDVERINHAFLRVATVAWWLSTQPDALTLNLAAHGLARYHEGTLEPGIEVYNLCIIPEVVGQIAGYARSTLRAPGLHMLVDVGAATFDVSAFDLNDIEGEDRYTFWATEVQPLGSYLLHQKRLAYLSTVVQNHFQEHLEASSILGTLREESNALIRVPQEINEYVPPCNDRVDYASAPDKKWEKACFRVMHKQLHLVRKKKNPHAPNFKRGIPIFLCGGGKEVVVYPMALREFKAWWQEHTKVAPFRIDSLPRPSNLQAPELPAELFDRLSVAYGLSYSCEDLGSIRPPHTISDIPDDPDGYSGPTYHEDTKDWT